MSSTQESTAAEAANGKPVYKPGEIDFDTLDETPEDYRKMLRTLIGKQYIGEIAACEMFSRAVFHLPDPRHKAALVHTANEATSAPVSIGSASCPIPVSAQFWQTTWG